MNKVLFLSGAGLSAESGLKTFRDNDGLWENFDVMEVCSVEGYQRDKQKVLDFYDLRRRDLKDKLPNETHFMIKRLKDKFKDEIVIITQNVDDLFEKTGLAKKDIVHLHGKLRNLICENCDQSFDIGNDSIKEYKTCPSCKKENVLRHQVVMFGEAAPEYKSLYYYLEQAELLVVIGTSGTVIAVEQFSRYVKYSILNNLEPSYDINDSNFDKKFYEPATTAAPKIEKLVDKFLSDGVL